MGDALVSLYITNRYFKMISLLYNLIYFHFTAILTHRFEQLTFTHLKPLISSCQGGQMFHIYFLNDFFYMCIIQDLLGIVVLTKFRVSKKNTRFEIQTLNVPFYSFEMTDLYSVQYGVHAV